jgi:hypothetical protein
MDHSESGFIIGYHPGIGNIREKVAVPFLFLLVALPGARGARQPAVGSQRK